MCEHVNITIRQHEIRICKNKYKKNTKRPSRERINPKTNCQTRNLCKNNELKICFVNYNSQLTPFRHLEGKITQLNRFSGAHPSKVRYWKQLYFGAVETALMYGPENMHNWKYSRFFSQICRCSTAYIFSKAFRLNGPYIIIIIVFID